MCTYSCSENGMATDWRFATYAPRAIGGAGLVMVEASSVDLIGRHSYAELGIWSNDHIPLAPHRRFHPGTRCGARDPVAACRPQGQRSAPLARRRADDAGRRGTARRTSLAGDRPQPHSAERRQAGAYRDPGRGRTLPNRHLGCRDAPRGRHRVQCGRGARSPWLSVEPVLITYRQPAGG
jgi:hypothetical protein